MTKKNVTIDLDEPKVCVQYLATNGLSKGKNYVKLQAVTKAGQPVKNRPDLWIGSAYGPNDLPEDAKFRVTIEQIG